MTRALLLAACALLISGPAPLALAGELTDSASEAPAREPVSMVGTPSLSPDGKQLAFAWDGDLWLASPGGGRATRITHHESEESSPVFSPDGKSLAFASRREGGVWQVFVMPVAGGTPRQVTFHSEGATPLGWYPDGKSLLLHGVRDQVPYNGYKAPLRFLRVRVDERLPEELLFDDAGASGSLSPDGTKLLFTREDHEPYRLGYRGSQSGQVWVYDLTARTFRCVLKGETGYRSPLWRPDGRAIYCLDASEGAYNLVECDLASGKVRPLTHGRSDNIHLPALSADGSTLVFRRAFDLFRIDPRKPGAPSRIALFNDSDRVRERTVRRFLKAASAVEFSPDGLEVFFASGGDLWCMDTTLAEPRPVASGASEESCPRLAPDGKSLFFLRDHGDACDIFRAERADPARYWWENDAFTLSPVTTDRAIKSSLRLSPDGKRLAYVRDRGDLVVCATDGSDPRVLASGTTEPQFDWSPDSRWIVFAAEDADFNRDIHLVPADGASAPVNVSRHPDNDFLPAFSPDGRCLAWLRQRSESAADLAFVWLSREHGDLSARDRKIEEAREKMSKERPAPKVAKPKETASRDAKPPAAPTAGNEAKPGDADKADKADEPAKAPDVRIDFPDMHRRVRTLTVPLAEDCDRLVWSSDSKKVGFLGTLDGKPGLIGVPVADASPKPEMLAAAKLREARALPKNKGFTGRLAGTPATFADKALTEHKFEARQEFDGRARRRAAFLFCWRLMRDKFYDPAMNNLDWNAVRSRYEEHAANAVDTLTFDRVVNMMLGELNASHLGYRSEKTDAWIPPQEWKVETAHLGVLFDPAHTGPGLRIRKVITDGPADRARSRLAPGEILLSVDGVAVSPGFDLTRVLNGPMQRDIALRVKGADGAERSLSLRPASYADIRKLLRADYLRDNAAKVASLSGGKLAYLHIAGMDWASFRDFEHGLYAEGAGKDGLVIDVRDNGGGFTTDHLLTILCQPTHAFTVARGGAPGYPHDRHVYAAWRKPVVVLCNQNSFSNAEVFSHAIRTLGRGKVVGVRTAGGVISTGSARVFDLGNIRLPFRGWYCVATGADYELNGATPDITVWTAPGDFAAGRDPQLEKAVEVLLKDVATAKPLPKPVNAHATRN